VGRVLPGPDGLTRAISSFKAFVPLLGWNLARNRVPLDPVLVTYLRSADLTEDIRWRKYRGICRAAFSALVGAGVEFVALKGAAFGELYYPAPTLRHTGDIDVLVEPSRIPQAAAALVADGWTQARARSFMARHLRHEPPLVHPSGVPLELHRRLTPSFYTIPYGTLRARTRESMIAGVPVRVFSAEDNLLHICLHGMGGERWLRWVFDAWFLVEREPALDWTSFVSTVKASRAALPVYAALGYLADNLGAPVPAHVIESLRTMAAASGFMACRAARPIPSGSPAQIWGSGAPVVTRLRRLGGRLVPSPIDLAVHFDIPLWQIPFDYVHRAARYAAHRLGGGR
jgi:hypothetical protein